ncbi:MULTISPECIES: FkbM family methyltransferase [unclassified Hyphomonas]|uniref:FkbM family methyltransferase n=1 Tax=unclassified Hyphomonas TaxID=2630699 RepID=UPI0004589A75|nr:MULTISPECIES: FkbM family methyltransferase [unclassified Hyphomonas]KCZ47290.1 hypothetical protein HY17_19035 [Hyphomonas sp. CY54-11-8]
MEGSNLFQSNEATEAWTNSGFVSLPVLRQLVNSTRSGAAFTETLNRYLLAFNGSDRSIESISAAVAQGDQAALAVQQALMDLGAWTQPYTPISGETYTKLKEKIAKAGRFEPETANVEQYPYYVPGKTLGYDVNWIRQAAGEAAARFERFKADRTGDTAILVGNGPSLNKVDFSLFKGRDVYVSNYAIKHPELRQYAKGVAVTNYLVADQEPYAFGLDEKLWKFFPFWLRNTLHPDEQTILLNADGGELFFSEDVLKNVAWHSTVTYFWLQILYSAGYDRVLMTGFDNSYQQKAAAKEGDLLVQKEEDPNHFDPAYFKGKTWQAADTGKMESTYVLSREKYEAAGKQLINCTVGGALEALPRQTLEDALKPARAIPPAVPESPRIALVTAFWKGDAQTAERHYRATQKYAPAGVDHIHVFKHGESQLPHLTMPRIVCADLEHRFPDAVDKPHPAGPNLTFICSAQLMKEMGYTHFFWFEPDCVPTQKGWLDPFLAALEANPDEPVIGTGGGTVQPGKPHWKNHFAGCSLYSVEALADLDWDRLIEKELDVSFDVWLARELGYIELGAQNDQDQDDTIIFGEHRYNWTLTRKPESVVTGMFEHWRPEKFLSKEQLEERLGWPQFKLFHAIKDPELLEKASRLGSPKAAIIIINYNNGGYLSEAIASALSNQQHYPDTDVIVVDDGSTDTSADIIRSFGSDITAVFLEHGINIPNFNQQRAMKAALAETDAEIICLMDGDDRFDANKVASVVPVFDELDVVLCQHGMQLIDKSGAPLDGRGTLFPDEEITLELYEREGRVNFYQPTSGLVYRRAYLEKCLEWLLPDEHVSTWLDVRTTRLAPVFGKVVSLKDVLGDWRRHPKSDSIRTDNVKERVALHHAWYEEESNRQRVNMKSTQDNTANGLLRASHAQVDETAIVAHLLKARKGRQHVMLDVGAHFGTSAGYFHSLGWSIHCFEPDPNNRKKLTARFGEAENVRIDPRAVSDKPATGLEFFTSDESTGISGLHAFRDTHSVTTKVDATTVAEIVRDRGIKSVDFLKIDVEGFDLNVLKGVPWDDLTPDVVECEFEDAKTLKLGHDWKTVADYLQDKGYAVYVSEWHPIVRYGIPHDWRRVFAYPEHEVDQNSWGNLLAFREDPGLEAVESAFNQLVTRRAMPTPQKVPPKTVQPSPHVPPPVRAGSEPPASSKKVWYYSMAHKLRSVSPLMFELLRFARRAMVHVMHSRILLAALVAIAALVAWFSLDARFGGLRPWLLVSTAFGVLTLILTYVAARAYAHAASLHIETHDLKAELLRLREQINQSSQIDKKLALRDARINEIRTSLENARTMLEKQGTELKQIEALKKADADLEAQRKSLEETVEAVRHKLGRVDSILTQKIVETKVSIDHANNRARAGVETATVLSGQVTELESRLAATDKWAQFDNTRWYQHFNRRLSDQHIQTLENEWRKRLSVPISKQVLGYMASRACDIERRLDGRLATSVEDILLRTLVARAVKGKTLDVLEIGTLFATGAAIIYDSAAPHFDKAHFTLLDPLEGYYNQTQADILTGQVINEDAVRRNLARVGMSDDEFTLIKHLSTEPEAMEAASRKTYDVLIIDGDHSYAGVKADFENYASMVKLGGYIILDDYNSPDWPDVTDYVDKELAGHDFVSPVGASWRTCVYRVVKAPAKSGRTTPVMSPESATTPYLERQTKADDIH